jgi:hypothetical protein
VEYEIIQFSRLRLADDLPRFVEALQNHVRAALRERESSRVG